MSSWPSDCAQPIGGHSNSPSGESALPTRPPGCPAQALQLRQEERLRPWLGRLLEWDIVLARGVKKGTEYLVNPKAYAAANLDIRPSLRTLEPHRLRALIEEDLRAYPDSLLAEIHRRLDELEEKDIRKVVYAMVEDGIVVPSGGTKNRRYRLA